MSKNVTLFFCFIMFAGIVALAGCATTPTSSGSTASSISGTASDEPSYTATDIQREKIPLVKQGYQGQTVAPVAYVNKTLSHYPYLGDASVGILPEYLLEAGFQPVESAAGSSLNALLTELKYGQSDRVNPATAAQIGEQLGAKYVFLGEVNSYRVVTPQGSRSINVMGFGVGLGGGKITYDLQVSGRLVSVETRAILAAKTVSHKETFNVEGGHIRTPYGSFDQSQRVKVEDEVGGKVLAHALSRLVSSIVQQLNSRPGL